MVMSYIPQTDPGAQDEVPMYYPPQGQNPPNTPTPNTFIDQNAENQYMPMTGETPLAGTVPTQWGQGRWRGTGGGTEAQQYYAWQEFYRMFGRNPTQSELSSLAGAYAGDPNRVNMAQGNQAVAQYFQNFANNPANIYSQQQKRWKQIAPEHYGEVQNMIQSIFGRQATQDEVDHYSNLIASGQADPFEIQQFLRSTPEFQNVQDKNFREGLDTDLQKSDTEFFNTQKGNIIQKYAQMGRATSPALDVALTQMAAELSRNRGDYLTKLSASQYGGNKENALRDYGETQRGVNERLNRGYEGTYEGNQSLNKRLQDITDYTTQANAWGDAMNRYGNQKPGWMDYLNAGLNVANTASKFM